MTAAYLNECGACGEDFGGVTLFDCHRVGVHDYTYAEGLRMEPPREDGRRCLSVEEMIAKGWTRNDRGRWIDPAKVAAIHAYKHRSEPDNPNLSPAEAA